MLKQQFPHKILWLASYPKSGNTWFRAFLTALMNGGEVEINNLKTEGIFSARETFDLVTDITSHYLYDEEAKLLIADVYRYLAHERQALSIVKVHDAFETDIEGRNIIPEDVTHCAVYFIRNPLDVAGSLANHMHFTMQDAVNMLNNPVAKMAPQPNNLNKNIQFRQNLFDWSSHVNSWTQKPSFPVYVARYEDMLTNTFETFNSILKFVGWEYPEQDILRAINATSFEQLRKQESEKGFSEKFAKSPKFFRSGTMKNWEKELSPQQITELSEKHKDVMEKYAYTR